MRQDFLPDLGGHEAVFEDMLIILHGIFLWTVVYHHTVLIFFFWPTGCSTELVFAFKDFHIPVMSHGMQSEPQPNVFITVRN